MPTTTAHRSRATRLAAIVVLGTAIGLLPVTPSAATVPRESFGPAVSGGPETRVPVGVWPLVPRPEVVRAFDAPDSPWGAGHRGVDLLGSPGAPVRAAMAGVITFAGSLAGRGVVVVDHGATRTTYEPVHPSVAPGDRVPAGGRIGRLQQAGSHCSPHACLHWGWLRGSTYLDPLLLVGAGPVRLLPLDAGTGPPAAAPAPRWVPPLPAYAGWVPAVQLLPRVGAN